MKKLLTIFACVFVGGCAINSQYGNYTELDIDAQGLIMNDAINRLSASYLPAKTTLYVCTNANTTDPFFSTLITALRQKGYAIVEQADPKTAPCFNYILDNVAADMWQITVFNGINRLSRAYYSDYGKLTPAGEWSLYVN